MRFLEENWRERTKTVNTEVTRGRTTFCRTRFSSWRRYMEMKIYIFLNLEHKPHNINFVVKKKSYSYYMHIYRILAERFLNSYKE